MTETSDRWQARREEAALALERLGADALAEFGGFGSAQLGWAPAASRWSVEQCFEHLISVQTPYIAQFRGLTEHGHSPTLWERISPFSRAFGRMVIRAAQPDNPRKAKTFSKFEPALGDGDVTVIPRFVEHQSALVDSVRRLPSDPAFGLKVITSRLSPVVTYTLDDCLTLLVAHGRRHFRQAQGVAETPGFPAQGS